MAQTNNPFIQAFEGGNTSGGAKQNTYGGNNKFIQAFEGTTQKQTSQNFELSQPSPKKMGVFDRLKTFATNSLDYLKPVKRFTYSVKQAIPNIQSQVGAGIQNYAKYDRNRYNDMYVKPMETYVQKLKDKGTDSKVVERYEKKLNEAKTNTKATDFLSKQGMKLKENALVQAKNAQKYYVDANLPIENPKNFFEMLTSPGWITAKVLENSASFVSSLGVSGATLAVTKNPQLAVVAGFGNTFAQEGGSMYIEAREAGLDDKQAQNLANLGGTVNGIIEMIPIGNLLNDLPQGKVLKKKIISNFVSIASQAVLEGSTESVQEMVSNAIAMTFDEDRELFEGVPESFIVGSATGATADVATTAVATTYDALTPNQSANQVNQKLAEIKAKEPTQRTQQEQELVEAIENPESIARTYDEYETITDTVKKYDNPDDFARTEFGATSDDSFGFIDPVLVRVNTNQTSAPINTQEVQRIVSALENNQEVPTPVLTFKDGFFDIEQGANIITAFKLTGENMPVIVKGEAPENFTKLKDIYNQVQAKVELESEIDFQESLDTLEIPESLSNLIPLAKEMDSEAFLETYSASIEETFEGTPAQFYELAKRQSVQDTTTDTQEVTTDERTSSVQEDTNQQETVANNRQFDYQSTQFNLPEDIANRIKLFAESIPKEELAKDGRELQPHVTLLYGLDNKYTFDDIESVVGGQGEFDITLGEMKAFKNDDQDVLYIEVKDPGKLPELNSKIDENLDTPGQTFPDYTPHITLAYLKKGEADKYIGTKIFDGTNVTLDNLVFSNSNGQQIKLDTNKSIETLNQELTDLYKNADPEVVNQAWSEVIALLDVAEAGGLIWGEDGVTGGYKSTFPKFVPEELRSRDLFDSVLAELNPDSLTFPPNSQPKKQALYEEILYQVDSIAGTDSDPIINQLKEAYNAKKTQKTKQEKTAKAPSRSTTGSKASVDTFAESINSVNPTGSVFVEYTPEKRATAPLANNMTTLDVTMGADPNDKITIFRGVSKSGRKINPGDFITTDINSALSYGSKVISKEVRLGDIVDDRDQPLGGDYLYRPGASEDLSGVKYTYKNSEWYSNYLNYLKENDDKFQTLDIWLDKMKASGKTKEQLTSVWNDVNKQTKKSKTTTTNNQTNFASTDDYADLPKITGKDGINVKMKTIPFPEMVQMARDLMDDYPKIKMPRKRKIGRPLGLFVATGKGEIIINPNIFNDVEQASKTLAHELGHLIDYLPDQYIERGGILPRIATLREFLRKTYTNDKVEAKIDKLNARKKELQAKRENNPTNKTLKDFRARLKDAKKNKRTAEAEDLQALIRETEKTRDTESSDKQLRKEIRTLDKEIKKLQKNGIKDKVVRDELWKLSKKWKPLQRTELMINAQTGKAEKVVVEITEAQADDSYLNYRKSAPELYADAISVLFNDPTMLKVEAPTFYKGFFENLEKKPQVKAEFMELWDKLNRESDEVISDRIENIYKGFKTAREKRLEIEKGKDDTRTLREKGSDFWHDFLFQHVTRFDPIYKKVSKNPNTLGLELSQATNARLALEEMQMRRNNSFLLLDKVQKEVIQPLEQLGKNAEDDMGVFLQLSRSLGDRADIANPLGLQKQYAQETLNFFENNLKKEKGYTDEEVEIFKQVADNFRKTIFSKVEEANAVGVYSNEFFNETAKPNKDTYVTFQVVDYIHENYVSASIKKATGTLKQVENPLVSTLMKTVALTEAIEIQKGKQQIVSDLIANFTDEISRAKPKMVKSVRVGWKAEEGYAPLELYEDGKRVAYNVDPYIAEMFNLKSLEPQEIHNLVKTASKFNSVFKPLVTTYNLSWGFFSNISRDTRRTYKNLATISKLIGNKKGVSLYEFATTWVKAIPEAKQFQDGQVTELMREMLDAKAYQMPFTNFDVEANNESSVAPLMRKYNLVEGLNKDKSNIRKYTKPIEKIISAIEYAGGTLETTTKVAGYQLLKKRTENTRLAGFVNRNYVGTPNFIDGGSQKQIDNNIFVFSNVMFQGVRTDLELAINPATRSGWWMRTFIIDIMPKLAMVAGASGLLGELIKEIYDKATEYDKTNYLVVPIGMKENGKAIYFRIPQDETGRFLSAMVWKFGSFLNGTLKKPEQILALGAGYLPSPTPLFEVVGGWINYVQGNNPYDSYRGRLVIDQTTWEAGGLPAFSKMVQWTSNSLGLSQFSTYSDETDTGFDTFLKQTPIINRAFKSTDYGLTEKERLIDQKLSREKAKQTLKERELFDSALKEARSSTNSEDRLKIRNDFIKSVVGDGPYDSDDKRKITNLKKKFKLGLLKGSVSREMDTLIDANNNAYKVELLKLYKESLPQDKYEDLVRTAFENKVISENVIDELRLEGQQSQIDKPNYVVYDLLDKLKEVKLVPQAYAADYVFEAGNSDNVAHLYNDDGTKKTQEELNRTIVEVPKNENESRLYIPGGGFFDFPKKIIDAVKGVMRGFFEIENEPIVFAKEEPSGDVLGATAPTPTATPKPEPDVSKPPKIVKTREFKGNQNVNPQIDTFIQNKILPVTRKYDIPDAVAVGMFAAEGRNLGLGANRNNFYNIAAFDSNVNSAFTFATPEQGVEAFAQFITGQYDRYASDKHKKKFRKAYTKYLEHRDPVKYVQDIRDAGYAGDPNTWRQRKLEQDGVETPFSDYAEFVFANPEWRKYYNQ